MDLDNLEWLKAEHGLDFGLENLASFSSCSFCKCSGGGPRGGLCILSTAQWVSCSTISLSFNYFEWSIDVEVESKICLGLVCECEFLDLLWSVWLVGDTPVFKSKMILTIHFLLAVNREHGIDSQSLQIKGDDTERSFLKQITVGC